MFTARDFIWSILIPLLVALAVSLLGWQPWRRGWGRTDGTGRGWVAPLAMGLAFLIGFPGSNAYPWAWPLQLHGDATSLLPWIAVVAMVLGVASASLYQPRWMIAVLMLLVSAITFYFFLKFRFNPLGWSAGVGAMLILLFAVACTAWWISLEQGREESPILGALLIGIASACAGLVLMLTGSLTYGKFPLILGFATAGLLPAALWRSEIRLRGLAATFSILIIPMLLGGAFLSSLPHSLLGLFLCTPVFILGGTLLPPRLRGWRRIVLRLCIAILPLAAAVIVAANRFHKTSDASDPNSYYNE